MKCCSSIPSKFVLLALLLTIFPLSAQKNFDSNSVIAPPILAMDAPKMWGGEGRNIGELNIPVSTNNDLVQKHVRQGFALLHAQWDVEA